MKTIRFELGNFKDVFFMNAIKVIEKDSSSVTFVAESDVSHILTSEDCVNYQKKCLNYCEVQLPDKDHDRKHETFRYTYTWVYPGADCCAAGELSCSIEVPQYMYIQYKMHKSSIKPYK